MQLYTKILLGMLVGAALGFTLGPDSPLLEENLYVIADASTAEFRLHKEDAASQITLPTGVPLRATALDAPPTLQHLEAEHPPPAAVWISVQFPFTKELGLRDPTGALRTRLGSPKTGAQVAGWLRVNVVSLEGGGFAVLPRPESEVGDRVLGWLSPVGEAFMRLIRMVVVPLVFASLLVGVASLGDVRKLGRLGGKTLASYLATTAIAVTIGLGCASLIRPGQYIDPVDRAALLGQFGAAADQKMSAAATAPSIVDTLLDTIPTNPVASLSQGHMLQIIFFAILLGVALTLLGPGESTVVITFFEKLQNAMIVVIDLVMRVAPYGVAALVAEVVGRSGLSILRALLIYGLTVVIGLALQAGLVYGGVVRFVGKMPWRRFLRAIRPAQLIAFSTSSSSATLPVTLECAKENLGISGGVASFVLPLGSTVNMDGTALYQGVAAVFIAQVFQIDLSVGMQLSIVLAATLASIGAAGVPGAGMITLALVLSTAGIPAVGLALILGVDRILDMFRTAVNVTGDLAIATAVARTEGEALLGRPVSERDQPRPGAEVP